MKITFFQLHFEIIIFSKKNDLGSWEYTTYFFNGAEHVYYFVLHELKKKWAEKLISGTS